MGDGRNRDGGAGDASWTDVEEVRPDLVEAVPIRHGMVLAGRYAIEQIIGRGGSGVVVRAHDRDLRQEVAIKIVRTELVGQRVWATRLAREVKLARQIQHPHVCRVFDFEQSDGRAFLVMELAEKGSLRDELRSGAAAARPLAERIADARSVASALAAIHAAGIVHRDVTPQNMLRMADGRLVLSDFGLATDASESTSVHGGTVAYMAPEVMLGGKASVASDIWALGVVMHEMVFGVKPRWSGVASPDMLAPDLGRRLSEEERRVLEACHACTAKDPARRVARADEAGRLLTERPHRWSRWRQLGWRPLVWVTALTIAGAAVIGFARTQRRPVDLRRSGPISEAALIVPTGVGADWTDVATVLVEVPDRVNCTRLLPDKRTVRFGWGAPPRSEDIDIVTRKRVPSPLVPAAYAEGCPDLSPDGKRLVYQGHAADGRAFAFLSARPDGRDAVPVVPTAEPSMSSEPTWLANGEGFSYDVDDRHIGLFATKVGHSYVVGEATSAHFLTAFRFVVGNRVFIEKVVESDEAEVIGIGVPALHEEERFRLPEQAFDLTGDESFLYYGTRSLIAGADLIEVDLTKRRARKLGQVRDQFIRHPMLARPGLVFESVREQASPVVRDNAGGWRRLTADPAITSVGHCGQDFIVSVQEGKRSIIERIDSAGRLLAVLNEGEGLFAGACSVDGRVWYYSRLGSPSAIVRCDQSGCRDLHRGLGAFVAPSPDGQKVALMAYERRGRIVNWSDADGGPVHEIGESETGCAMGWASPDTLWVSRRRAGTILWTEVNIHTRAETGRTVRGTRDCSDGRADPASPVDPDVRMAYDQTSQIRLLAREHLPRH